MKVRKAIFDKRFFEKETIMALYATKKAFSVADVFGDYVQNRKKPPFGDFFRGKKADPHFQKTVKTVCLRCAPALVCRKDKSLCKGNMHKERRKLCQKEREYSLLSAV